MASTIYPSFLAQLMAGEANLVGSVVKAMLVTSAYRFDPAHRFRSEIQGETKGDGYSPGGKVVDKKIVSFDPDLRNASFDAGDVEWPEATITARGLILYVDRGEASKSPLICYFDFGTDRSSSNDRFRVRWHESGILVGTAQITG